jgi:P-type Ca2+ transporter type 2C
MGAAPTMWHARSIDQTVTQLHSDSSRGLAGSEVTVRQARYGRNALRETKQRSALAILLHQFRSLIVALLITAGVVALSLGEIIEAVAILVVIALNAVIGFVTEWKANKALNGLRQQTVAVARVMRDGAERLIPAEELVPGDVVLLGEGDRVPADGRVIEQAQLQIDEAALTGESLSVTKSIDPLADSNAVLGDRMNMVHLGTAVSAGRGKVIVTTTGPQTEMGKIGTLIADVDDHGTPLEAKLAQLSRALLVVVHYA